jgi:hypothetical protein
MGCSLSIRCWDECEGGARAMIERKVRSNKTLSPIVPPLFQSNTLSRQSLKEGSTGGLTKGLTNRSFITEVLMTS